MQRFFTVILFLSAQAVSAQSTLSRLQTLSDSLIAVGIGAKSIPGIALVLMKGDSTYTSAHGLANVEKNIPADTTTLFQLGSVGKLFTVIAVLQQVEAGTLSLTEDVNNYLDEFKTDPPLRPITLKDLLTHTAGLDERVIGYLARSESDVMPLAEHLREYLPPSFQPPGVDINYSNYSYALAGHLVERVTGVEFTKYVALRIFKPLGMVHTTYALPDNYQKLDNYAYGYRTRDTFEPITGYPRHATPAGSAISSAGDMAKFMAELRKPSGKLLSDVSMALLFERQFSNHSLLKGYTLGMEEQNMNGHRGVGKGGAFTGFISELAIFPQDSLALFFSLNTQTDNFMELFVKKLMQEALPSSTLNISPPIKMDVDEFAGVYRSERTSHHTVEELFSLYQGKLELSKGKDGNLTIYQNDGWQTYVPIDPLVFQNKGTPTQYLVFRRDGSGSIDRLYTNIIISGFNLPVSLSPVQWYDHPEMINEYYGLVLLFILTAVFVPLYRVWVYIRRKRNPSYLSWPLVPGKYLGIAVTVAVLFTFHFICGALYLVWNINEFYFGATDFFKAVQYLTWTFPPLVLILVIASVNLWRAGSGTRVFRIYYLLITLSSVVHLLFLYRWHFIGLHV
jgi:CubicO group peptidase (beta-lactamase class C family)